MDLPVDEQFYMLALVPPAPATCPFLSATHDYNSFNSPGSGEVCRKGSGLAVPAIPVMRGIRAMERSAYHAYPYCSPHVCHVSLKYASGLEVSGDTG